MPAHIIPSSFYNLLPVEPGQKQCSLITVFAIGNLMIGTSSLTMPWAIQQAGLLMGLFIILFMCAFSCYTSLVIVNLTFKYGQSFHSLLFSLLFSSLLCSALCFDLHRVTTRFISVDQSLIVSFGF